jgi:hypothetical protein
MKIPRSTLDKVSGDCRPPEERGQRVDKPPFLDSWAPSPAPLNYNVFRAPLVAFSGNANITLEVYAHLFARVAPRIPHAPRSTPASHAAIAGGND